MHKPSPSFREQPCWVIGLTLLSLLFAFPITAQEKKKKPAAPPEGVTVQRDIVFATHDGIALALDLYLPKAESESPLPVVIWVHGGG